MKKRGIVALILVLAFMLSLLSGCNMKCMVTFDYGVNGRIYLQEVDKNALVPISAIPVVNNSGKILEGWYRDKSFTDRWQFDKDKATGETTLYAHWINDDNEKCTVTFVSKGITVSTQKQLKGKKIDELPNINRAGYEFAGWFIDAECLNEFDVGGQPVNEDITLYAKWKLIHVPQTFTVTFYYNFEGYNVYYIKDFAKGEMLSSPNPPQIEGYEFCGWFSDAACLSQINIRETKICENIAVYAKWRKVD